MATNDSSGSNRSGSTRIPTIPWTQVQPKDRYQISKRFGRIYNRNAYQVPEEYLRKIYGRSTHSFAGRKIYDGSLNKGHKFHPHLKPLGIGEIVKYVKYKTVEGGYLYGDSHVYKPRYDFKIARKLQVIRSKRIIGDLSWDANGNPTGVRTKSVWKSQPHKRNTELALENGKWVKKFGGLPVIEGKYFPEHLRVAAHMVEINTVFFVQTMMQFAKNFFQHSFDTESFEGEKWEPLSSVTLNLRARRGIKGTRILQERGKLRESFDTHFTKLPFGAARGTIFTKNVEDRDGGMVCYAGVHNEGGHGVMFNRHYVQIPRRQFMGYSKRIDNFYFSIRNKYFLDDVFTTRTRIAKFDVRRRKSAII